MQLDKHSVILCVFLISLSVFVSIFSLFLYLKDDDHGEEEINSGHDGR